MDLQAISYEVGGRTFTGYLWDGAGGRCAPGVLVGHEGPGLGDHVKERAAMLAEVGYVALAMDLYGEVDPPMPRAMELVRSLMSDTATLRARTRAALELLKAQPTVDPARTAAIGFCFGGAAVLELARSGADVACVVGFHAALTTTAPEPARDLNAKVLVCLGADDAIVTAEHRDGFAAEMTAARADWQMIIYGRVGHSFTNRDIDAFNYPGFSYDGTADRRSWRAMRDFFDEVLGPVAV